MISQGLKMEVDGELYSKMNMLILCTFILIKIIFYGLPGDEDSFVDLDGELGGPVRAPDGPRKIIGCYFLNKNVGYQGFKKYKKYLPQNVYICIIHICFSCTYPCIYYRFNPLNSPLRIRKVFSLVEFSLRSKEQRGLGDMFRMGGGGI